MHSTSTDTPGKGGISYSMAEHAVVAALFYPGYLPNWGYLVDSSDVDVMFSAFQL